MKSAVLTVLLALMSMCMILCLEHAAWSDCSSRYQTVVNRYAVTRAVGQDISTASATATSGTSLLAQWAGELILGHFENKYLSPLQVLTEANNGVGGAHTEALFRAVSAQRPALGYGDFLAQLANLDKQEAFCTAPNGSKKLMTWENFQKFVISKT